MTFLHSTEATRMPPLEQRPLKIQMRSLDQQTPHGTKLERPLKDAVIPPEPIVELSTLEQLPHEHIVELSTLEQLPPELVAMIAAPLDFPSLLGLSSSSPTFTWLRPSFHRLRRLQPYWSFAYLLDRYEVDRALVEVRVAWSFECAPTRVEVSLEVRWGAACWRATQGREDGRLGGQVVFPVVKEGPERGPGPCLGLSLLTQGQGPTYLRWEVTLVYGGHGGSGGEEEDCWSDG